MVCVTCEGAWEAMPVMQCGVPCVRREIGLCVREWMWDLSNFDCLGGAGRVRVWECRWMFIHVHDLT